MNFPILSDTLLRERLEPPAGVVNAVLDTDTYNEVDDQFALAYALLAPERINLQAVYAAPFHNTRSSGPGDGMERSYSEIVRVMEKMQIDRADDVFRGSPSYLASPDEPVQSKAAQDLVARATAAEDVLYVMAIGALTNVASAILLAPEIIGKIVVVWLGGQPVGYHEPLEFNLGQDVHAARVLFNSGVPLVWIPCGNVAEHLRTTLPELAACIRGRSNVGDYLYDIVAGYTKDDWCWSKVIWDVAVVAWLVNPEWVPLKLISSPILNDDLSFAVDANRHPARVGVNCNRDAIFRDLFDRLNELP